MLTAEQIAEYRKSGYLFFPNLLSKVEIEALRAAIPTLIASDGPEVTRGKSGSTPRVVYAPHVNDPLYQKLVRLPRILGTVEELLAESVYVYQSRINLKLPFSGDAWSWHQDFTAWHRGDGMPRPNAIMTAVFIDDCTVANGPLLVMPGSQSDDLETILGREEDVEGYDTQRISTSTLQHYAEQGGILDLEGPAGSVAFIHPTLLHGSASNMTPWPRSIYYINYNTVSNLTVSNERPWYMNNTDATPLEQINDDALVASAHID